MHHVAVSGKGNFVVAIKSFHDGHTLYHTVQEIRKIVDEILNQVFVDRGYAGNNFSEKSKVYSHNSKKKLSKNDKKMLKRRSAIEPIIGHLKNFCRMAETI
jgi:IS5 family transposase